MEQSATATTATTATTTAQTFDNLVDLLKTQQTTRVDVRLMRDDGVKKVSLNGIITGVTTALAEGQKLSTDNERSLVIAVEGDSLIRGGVVVVPLADKPDAIPAGIDADSLTLDIAKKSLLNQQEIEGLGQVTHLKSGEEPGQVLAVIKKADNSKLRIELKS